MPDWSKELLVDLISLSRIPLSFSFLYFLSKGELFACLLVLLVGGISDKLDGFLARLLNVEKSFWGKILDPVGDRFFIVICFLSLYYIKLDVDVSTLAVFLTVFQDLILAPMGFYKAFVKGQATISYLGKIATLYQYLFLTSTVMLNLLKVSVSLHYMELILILLNLLSAGHHIYLWLPRRKS
ncbi:MAG: CDP-alcohol phosphatidyltransferase family protein [Acidobacteria bacterium]|nr:MAG: CDP-alcohol phosphatidyltransferase family protein [Acidobacteriota bacterium]